MEKGYSVRRTAVVMILIVLTMLAVSDAPIPLNLVPGWFFWEILFVVELIHLASLGRPRAGSVTDYQLLRFDIGMDQIP